MTSTGLNQSIKKTMSALSQFMNEFSTEFFETNDEPTAELFMAAFTAKTKTINNLLKTSLTPKPKKDPNAPKRPSSSYIFFCKEVRPTVTRDNPDMSGKDIIREFGRLWKKVSDTDREEYKALATNDKKRYEAEMKDYVPPEPVEGEEPVGKKKRAGPKRPRSSYIYYCKHNRSAMKEEYPDLSGKDITRELAKKWEDMTITDKEPYNKEAETDKKRYFKEKAAYLATLPTKSDAKSDAKSESESESESDEKSETRPKPKKTSGKPKNKSGYFIFCQKRRPELANEYKDLAKSKIRDMVNAEWRDMDKEEKDGYISRAKGGVSSKV